jgi:hypothetical protein
MTKSKIKVKEHENLSEANIKRVIELLEAEKPIPKKDAYAILNISPNPTRLAKIIENYKEEKAELQRRLSTLEDIIRRHRDTIEEGQKRLKPGNEFRALLDELSEISKSM